MRLEEKLVFYRNRKGLSREQAAEALEVSRQSVYKWEKGIVVPGMESLIRLSKLYGLSLDELVNKEIESQNVPEPEAEVTEPEAEVPEPEPEAEVTIPEPEPVEDHTRKRASLSVKKRIVIAICIAATILIACVGIYSFKVWKEGRDIVPIKDLERWEVDIQDFDRVYLQ